MLSSEEKLQRFSESVYQDAQNQCNALIEEAKKRLAPKPISLKQNAWRQLIKQLKNRCRLF